MKIMRYFIYLIVLSLAMGAASPAFAQDSLRFEIKGLGGEPLQNVTTRLNDVENAYGNLSSANIQDFILHAPENIRHALEPFGYFQAKVTVKYEQSIATFLVDP